LAVVVSLLAFPALEDLLGASREQYTGRIYLIGLVLAAALLSGLVGTKLAARRPWLPWLLLALVGLLGAAAPTWMYWQVAPYVGQVIGLPVGVGWGVWLNVAGHGLVTAVAVWQLWSQRP
jgi:fucose 4-O-acetylase-like acetyltransferase